MFDNKSDQGSQSDYLIKAVDFQIYDIPSTCDLTAPLRLLSNTIQPVSAEDTNFKRFYNTNGKQVMELGQGGPVIMSDQVKQAVAQKVHEKRKGKNISELVKDVKHKHATAVNFKKHQHHQLPNKLKGTQQQDVIPEVTLEVTNSVNNVSSITHSSKFEIPELTPWQLAQLEQAQSSHASSLGQISNLGQIKAIPPVELSSYYGGQKWKSIRQHISQIPQLSEESVGMVTHVDSSASLHNQYENTTMSIKIRKKPSGSNVSGQF